MAFNYENVKMQSWARDNFLTFRQQQRNNEIELHWPEKRLKIIRSRCLNGLANINI